MTSFEKFAGILHDTSDIWFYSCYLIDLGIVSCIFEDEDYKNQRIFVVSLTVDFQIQGHALFCVTFHISGWIRAIGKISVSISTYSRSRITIVIYSSLKYQLVTFKFKVTRYFAWPSISQAGFVLSDRSRRQFTHIWGQGSQQWYTNYCNINQWPSNSRSLAILRDILYLRLDSCYQRDLGAYFHKFEVKDHNNDKTNTAI